jgi:hypothetical protein
MIGLHLKKTQAIREEQKLKPIKSPLNYIGGKFKLLE